MSVCKKIAVGNIQVIIYKSRRENKNDYLSLIKK